VTEYYEILAIKKDCEEADVKKAYRKLALQLHPDKNGAPGADEAFKMVSKAFQVLSDPQKRAAYDELGADPDSRFGGMSSGGGGSQFRTASFNGGGMEGEISPEELFNMFFGGGGGAFGSPFDGPGIRFGGPGVFTASFGPGGFRTNRHMHRNRAQRDDGPAAPREVTIRSVLSTLLPFILLFAFTVLSAIPNILSTPRTADPYYSFEQSPRYSEQRQTSNLGVKYHVNPNEFSTHPIANDMSLAQRENRQSSLLAQFEGNVEQRYTSRLYNDCQIRMERKQRRKEAKSGFLGFGADWDGIKAIDAERVESCDELRRMGVIQ